MSESEAWKVLRRHRHHNALADAVRHYSDRAGRMMWDRLSFRSLLYVATVPGGDVDDDVEGDDGESVVDRLRRPRTTGIGECRLRKTHLELWTTMESHLKRAR